MKTTLRQLAITLTLIILAACQGKPGSQFLGKWQKLSGDAGSPSIEIVAHGDQYQIDDGAAKVGAAYKDGTLVVSSIVGEITFSYVKDSDHLLALGAEYARKK